MNHGFEPNNSLFISNVMVISFDVDECPVILHTLLYLPGSVESTINISSNNILTLLIYSCVIGKGV